MAHEHRFDRYSAGSGGSVERCKGCFRTRDEIEAERAPRQKPEPEAPSRATQQEEAVQQQPASATVPPSE